MSDWWLIHDCIQPAGGLLIALYVNWDHSFSTFAKFSEKLIVLTPWYIRTRTCAYQRVRNISFSENFAYVLNEWPLANLIRNNKNTWSWGKIRKLSLIINHKINHRPQNVTAWKSKRWCYLVWMEALAKVTALKNCSCIKNKKYNMKDLKKISRRQWPDKPMHDPTKLPFKDLKVGDLSFYQHIQL